LLLLFLYPQLLRWLAGWLTGIPARTTEPQESDGHLFRRIFITKKGKKKKKKLIVLFLDRIDRLKPKGNNTIIIHML
jgi:hypothetical protein